jgi:hypothetical protein
MLIKHSGPASARFPRRRRLASPGLRSYHRSLPCEPEEAISPKLDFLLRRKYEMKPIP